ncbi:MAG: L-histidine N(alpha)-methyltransferase [Armatimonadetes bacterium]|nr:L-histidine N(alpha)-methyltransferase [Armatimonadota bacterium]
MVHIKVLLRESEIAREFLAALAARSIPEKFFYWFPLSVRSWLDLCGSDSYKNFSRSYGLIEQSAAKAALHIPPGQIEVLSLGAGQGDKDMLILEALSRSGHPLRYIPADSSQALLETACDAAQKAGFSSEGIKLDIADARHLECLRPDPAGPPRVTLILGNTLGAFDPFELCAALNALLRPADFLLLDGELYCGEETMAGYDNPANRRFAFAPLRSIGITEEDGRLCFEANSDPRLSGLYYISKHFLPVRDLDLNVGGEALTLKKCEALRMNFSYKYTRAAFEALLKNIGALRTIGEYVSSDGRFVMRLTARSDG